MVHENDVARLLWALVRDNPDKPALRELARFLAPEGRMNADRFAAVMIFATRLVAYVPGAGRIFADQVEGIAKLTPRRAAASSPGS